MARFKVDGRERTIHFGAAGYNDYTIYSKNHGKAKAAQMRNIARHSRISNFRNPLTAASLSRYVLWEKPTIAGGIRAYKQHFGL